MPRYAEDLRTIKFLSVKPLVGLIASADQLKSSWPVAGIAERRLSFLDVHATCVHVAGTRDGFKYNTIRTRRSMSNSTSAFLMLHSSNILETYSFSHKSNASFHVSV